jgi:cobyric acid synthase
VLGYVLNQIDNQPSLAAQTNREALASLTGVPCLGELPHLQGVKTGTTASADWLDGRLELRLLGSVLNHDKR